MRTIGGVVNTTIVMAAAEGIIAAQDLSLYLYSMVIILRSRNHGRMRYVKRKCSNAVKISLPHFKEIQENFFADIQAEVVMNEVPPELIFNWD